MNGFLGAKNPNICSVLFPNISRCKADTSKAKHTRFAGKIVSTGNKKETKKTKQTQTTKKNKKQTQQNKKKTNQTQNNTKTKNTSNQNKNKRTNSNQPQSPLAKMEHPPLPPTTTTKARTGSVDVLSIVQLESASAWLHETFTCLERDDFFLFFGFLGGFDRCSFVFLSFLGGVLIVIILYVFFFFGGGVDSRCFVVSKSSFKGIF